MKAMIAGQLQGRRCCTSTMEAQIEGRRARRSRSTIKLTDVDPYQHYDMLVTMRRRSHRSAHYYRLPEDVAATSRRPVHEQPEERSTRVAPIATVTGDTGTSTTTARCRSTSKMNWWPLEQPGPRHGRMTRTIGLNVKLGNIPNGNPSRGRASSTRGCGRPRTSSSQARSTWRTRRGRLARPGARPRRPARYIDT